MKTRTILFAAMILAAATFFSACSQESSELQDGYYSAEMANFDEYGWKEFITIHVSGDKIVTVEYNAKNASGFIKSWDMAYMRTMNAVTGTYPNEYTRTYSISLLNWQNPDEVDAVTGATHSYTNFQALAKAVIAQAEAGDKQVAQVETPAETEGALYEE